MRKFLVTLGVGALLLSACANGEEPAAEETAAEETAPVEEVEEPEAPEEPAEVEEPEEEPDQAGDWDEQVRTNFMDACLATSGGASGYCECTLDGLEDTYDQAEFEQVEQEMLGTDEIPAEFEQIIEACVEENQDEISGDPTEAAEGEWSQLSQSEFLNACIQSSGGATEYCECALDGMMEEYTEDEFVEVSLAIDAGEPEPDEFMDVVEDCAAQHG